MIGLLAAAALLAAPPAPARTEGTVVQTTAARAYLDAGYDDGLAPGVELVFHRTGTEVARCRLEVVSARASACTIHGVRAGDRFPLPSRPSAEEPRPLPAPPSREAQAAARAAVAAAPIALVSYTPPSRPGRELGRAVATAELSEAAWVATSAGPFTATRAAVALHGAELGMGLRLDLDAQAIRWGSRPSDPPPRFRPRDASQLYLWQASVSTDGFRDGLSVAAGRVLAWRIPGATVLDGAVAGWRRAGLEVGALAGFVPDPRTLALTTDRSTAGGWWAWDAPLGHGLSLRDEGRLAVVHSPELGTRLEAETRAIAAFGRALDLSGALRLGFGGEASAPGNVDAAWVELAARPDPRVRLAAWLAYDGLAVARDVEPLAYPGHSRRAEGSATVQPWAALRITLLAGTAGDLSSHLERQWYGPILDFPGLLFRRGGLQAGYLEERGWSVGRSAWLQAVARPWSRLGLTARVTWSEATAFALMQDDLGVALAAVADLTEVFKLRLSVSARGALTDGPSEGGGTAFATLAARY